MVNHNANINKAKLTETDIITKFTMPAVKNAGWDDMTQIRQEVKLCDGKVIERGQMGMRTTVKSVDIVLYHKSSMPLAVVEAKANNHEVGKGMQQALDYTNLLDFPLVFPPLEEQNSISSKVDELMALCDQLKARLADAQTTQLHLTDAIIEQAV